MRVAPFLAALSTLWLAEARALAEPEWNVAAQPSICALGHDGALWKRTVFCGAVRGDLLVGRDRNSAFAVGPYLSLGTVKFEDVRFGAGLSLLIPTLEGDVPLVLSLGGLSRDGRDVRVATQAFFGIRSHNFHGSYAMASGVVLGGDASLTSGHDTTMYAGLQVDGLWLALPFLLGYEWLKPNPDPGD